MRCTERVEHDRALYLRGLELFNAGEFFDCHDRWEDLWLRNRSELRPFLQGLIQLAAAFHQLERGNHVGMVALLRAARERLAAPTAAPHGLELGPLLLEIEGAEAHARDLGPGRLASFDRRMLPRLLYTPPTLEAFRPHAGTAAGPRSKQDWFWDRAAARTGDRAV